MTQRFQVNLAGIIDLLSAHLYSGPEVYVRELLQNGVDALTARAALAGRGDAAWGVRMRSLAEESGRVLIVEDDGVGLLPDEMERFLSTIGESSKRGALDAARADLLGQFGIGLLSCFMITDEIVVTSRSARKPDAPVVRWTGKSDGTYVVDVVDGERMSPGTRVRIAPKAGAEEWIDAGRVRELATRFGVLLPWPVRVDDGVDDALINPTLPPWQRDLSPTQRKRALLDMGRALLGEEPFDVIPLHSDAGDVDGAAFVLGHPLNVGARRGDRVYVKGMLLSEDAPDLLPEWAFFVKAVVNARALRPTASRESLYEDAILDEARAELGSQIRTWLLDLAKTDVRKRDRLVSLHHLAMKQLAAQDDEFLEIILDALPFETTHGEQTFANVRRLAAARGGDVRFTTLRDAFRQMAPLARAQDLLVVNAAYVFEADILDRAARLHSGTLKVRKAEPADLARQLDDAGDDAAALADLAQAALADVDVDVAVKRFTPRELPSFYAAGDDVLLKREIERARAAQRDQDAWGGALDELAGSMRAARPELVLNASCPLVAKLIELAHDDDAEQLVSSAVRLIYVQALMLGHHALGPRELTMLNGGLVELLEHGLGMRGTTQ